MATPKLIVIVGPTASGKTALAISIAKKFNGEIICADSRTVYKGLNIGTAKPTLKEQAEVPHYMLDLIEPDQVFTAAEFKRRTQELIDNISGRGKLPILVGGTGLYIDGVIFDFAFLPLADPQERAELESKTVEELQQEIIKLGIQMPENSKNKRYLIRALETNGEIPVKKGLRKNTLLIGLDPGREKVKERINKRVEKMVDVGLIDEIKDVSTKYGWDAPALRAPGYKAFREYIEGRLTLAEAKELFVKNDFNLAKRQMTWFKRNSLINWFSSSNEVEAVVKNFLQK